MEFCIAKHECTCTQQVHNVPYLMIFTHLRQQHKRNYFSVLLQQNDFFCYDSMQNANAFAKVTTRRPRSSVYLTVYLRNFPNNSRHRLSLRREYIKETAGLNHGMETDRNAAGFDV